MTYGAAAIIQGGLSRRFEAAPLKRRLLAFVFGAPDPHSHIRWSALKHVLAASPVAKNRDVLEIGCGEGFMSFEIAQRMKPLRLIGIEPEPTANPGVEKISNGQFVAASATDMPFESDSFDCAFMVDVLEHIEDDNQALRELHRVLRPCATLFLSVPTPRYPRWFGAKFHESIGHVRPGYETAQIVDLLRAHGFDVTTSRQHTGLLSLAICGLYYRRASSSAAFAALAVLLARVSAAIECFVPSPMWGGVAVAATKTR